MNDAMNIQKVSFPISPAQRVIRLKKDHPDSQKKRFKEDFEEEKDGDENKEKGVSALEMTEASDEKGKRGKGNFGKAPADSSTDTKKRNIDGTVGGMVDILV